MFVYLIFIQKKEYSICFGKGAAKSQIILKNCQYLSRMLNAIKYVQSLHDNIEDEVTRNCAFEMYINEEYRSGLQDYNHIISTHSHHLEDIYEQLDECSLSECKMAARCNNNDRRMKNVHGSDNDNSNSSKIKFYSDLIDRIHFWLFHQFEVGMRIQRNITIHDEKQEILGDDEEKDMYLDHKFAKLKQEINKRRDKWKSGESGQPILDKYTLHIHSKDITKKNASDEHTFIGSILNQLQEEIHSPNIISAFRAFISNEQYDSDAIIEDITEYANGSNIINCLNDPRFVEFFQDLSYNLNCMLLHRYPFCLFNAIIDVCMLPNTNSEEIQLRFFLVLLGLLQR